MPTTATFKYSRSRIDGGPVAGGLRSHCAGSPVVSGICCGTSATVPPLAFTKQNVTGSVERVEGVKTKVGKAGLKELSTSRPADSRASQMRFVYGPTTA